MSKRKPYISPIDMAYTVCRPEIHIIQVGKVDIDRSLREMHSLHLKVRNVMETEGYLSNRHWVVPKLPVVPGEYEMRQELFSLLKT